MKIPKSRKRYCPYCNAVTEQKVKQVSTGHKKSSLKRGSKIRARLRGVARGMGNLGRYSKKAASKFKRKTKTSKKTQLVYTCSKCNKSKMQKRGKRVSKVVIE